MALNQKTFLKALALSFILQATPVLDAASVYAATPNKTDIKAKAKQIEEKRHELHKKLAEARRKEKIAFVKLNTIKHALKNTEHSLEQKKIKVEHTVAAISQTTEHLNTAKVTVNGHMAATSQRLKEIYQGHRMNFLDMIFQADSLQSLIDRLYYNERVTELDRNLTEVYRQKARALEENKNRLGKQKSDLDNLVDQIGKKALEMARLKDSQEEIAEKLANQRAFFEQAEADLARQSKSLEKQILAMESSSTSNSGGPVTKGTGTMAMPLRAKITSPFGWRKHPIFRSRKFHTGVDIAGPRRSPIRSADSGHVLYTGWYGGYGKVVIVSHGNGMSTLYAHLAQIAVAKGSNVSKGDTIGYEGTTGFSTGPHLHFEVREQGIPKNPLNYVN